MDNVKIEDKNTIGSYTLIKEIGEGTFGKVYLGVHNLTQLNVAVKILERNKIQDSSDYERLIREIKILKNINNKFLVKLYDIFESNIGFYLIMEYVENGELFDYIVKDKKLKEKEAKKIFSQLILSIEYLHNNNIVHRDIKPENIFLNRKFDIKLGDMGLGKMYTTDELLKTACGSPCYAAPEMLNNQDYDPLLIDIWSSGIVLFAMVCGYLPFDDDDTDELYKKIIKGNFEIPWTIGLDCVSLIKKILDVDPKERINIKKIKNNKFLKDEIIKQEKVMNESFNNIDELVYQEMSKFGWDKNLVKDIIDRNILNEINCIFNLLKKKIIDEDLYNETLNELDCELVTEEKLKKNKNNIERISERLSKSNQNPLNSNKKKDNKELSEYIDNEIRKEIKNVELNISKNKDKKNILKFEKLKMNNQKTIKKISNNIKKFTKKSKKLELNNFQYKSKYSVPKKKKLNNISLLKNKNNNNKLANKIVKSNEKNYKISAISQNKPKILKANKQKEYQGPLNLSLIFNAKIYVIYNKLLKIVNELKIIILKINEFKYKIVNKFNKIEFFIEIQKIKKYQIITFDYISGDLDKYFNTIDIIQSKLKEN